MSFVEKGKSAVFQPDIMNQKMKLLLMGMVGFEIVNEKTEVAALFSLIVCNPDRCLLYRHPLELQCVVF